MRHYFHGPLIWINYDGFGDNLISNLRKVEGCDDFRICHFGEKEVLEKNDLNIEIEKFLINDIGNQEKSPKNILHFIGKKSIFEKHDNIPIACIHISFNYKTNDFGQWFSDRNDEFHLKFPKSMNINVIDNKNYEGEYLGFDVTNDLDGFFRLVFQEIIWEILKTDDYVPKSSNILMDTFKSSLNFFGSSDDIGDFEKLSTKAMNFLYLKKWEESSALWIGLLMRKKYSRKIFSAAIYTLLMSMDNDDFVKLHKVTILIDVWIKFELRASLVSDDSFQEIIQIISQFISIMLSTNPNPFLIEICTSVWLRSVIWISENYNFDNISIAYINLIASYLFHLSGMTRLVISRIILISKYSHKSKIFDYIPKFHENIQPLSSRLIISRLVHTYPRSLLKQSIESDNGFHVFEKLGDLMIGDSFSPNWASLSFAHKNDFRIPFEDYIYLNILIDETMRLIGKQKEDAELIKMWLYNSENILIDKDIVRISNVNLSITSLFSSAHSLIPKKIIFSSIFLEEYICSVCDYSYNYTGSYFNFIEFYRPEYTNYHPLRILYIQFEVNYRKLNISCNNIGHIFWFKHKNDDNSIIIKDIRMKRNGVVVPDTLFFYNNENILDSIYLDIIFKHNLENIIISSIGLDHSNFQRSLLYEKDILQCVQDKGDLISLSDKIKISKSSTKIYLAPFSIKYNGTSEHGKLYLFISSFDSLVSSSKLLMQPYVILESFIIEVVQKFNPYNSNVLFKLTNVSNDEFSNIIFQSKSCIYPPNIELMIKNESKVLLYETNNPSNEDYIVRFVAENKKVEHCFSLLLV